MNFVASHGTRPLRPLTSEAAASAAEALSALFEPYFAALADREAALLAGFDARGRLIFWAEGTTARRGESAFHPRDLRAMLGKPGLASAIVAHNHPSGACTPSAADIAFTRDVASLCKACGVCLHDHLIHAAGDWYSFRAEGLI